MSDFDGEKNPALHLLGKIVSRKIPTDQVPVDLWTEIGSQALLHGLGPMLLWAVKQTNDQFAGAEALQPLMSQARWTAVRYIWLKSAQVQVQDLLIGAGIPCIWLKGISLAPTVYPQPVLRPMNDLDVLVPYDQRETALELVQAAGYRPVFSDAQAAQDPIYQLIHHYTLRGGPAGETVVELHYRLLGLDKDLLPLDKLNWFWSQTQTHVNGRGSFNSLKPEAHLLYLCAHAILQHGEAESNLGDFFDLHQIITHHKIDWSIVIGQAVILRWSYAVRRALSIAIQYFETPIPQDVMQGLQAIRGKNDFVRRAVLMQGKGARWESVRVRLSRLTMREKIQFLWRLVFPSRDYMRQRYHVKPHYPVWPYYAVRWLGQARTVGWWAWERFTNKG